MDMFSALLKTIDMVALGESEETIARRYLTMAFSGKMMEIGVPTQTFF